MNDIGKRVFIGMIWKFSERVLAQFISLIVSIVLARLLEPRDYGVVAIVLIFITIADVFVTNGFGNALIQKKEADNVDFSTVFYLNILMGVVLYIVLFFIAPIISGFYKYEELTVLIRVLGIRIIIASINSVQQAYVSRNMLFKRFFWSTLFGTLISGIVGVLLAIKGVGVWALIAQYLTNTVIDTTILWFTVRWRPDKVFSLERAKTLFSYGWKILVSGLIEVGYKQIRGLIIGKKYSAEDLAFYKQGDKFPSLIVNNINSSISSVIFPAMAFCQDDSKKIKEMTRKAIQISSYVLWPCMLGLAAVADSFVKTVLSDKWLFSVPYIQLFCISYGFWPIHTANLQAINALGRSDIFLKLEIIKKIIGVGLILVSMNINPMAMAGSLVLADLISMFINSYPNKKLLRYGYLEQIRDIITYLIASFFMAVVIFPIKYVINPGLLCLIIQILVGVLIWIMYSLLLKPQAFQYLFSILRKMKG